jgi:putative polyketide hydroxylase
MSVVMAPEIPLERRSASGALSRISSGELFGKSYVLLAGSDGFGWCEAAEAIRGRLAGVSLDIYRVGSKELRDPDGRFSVEFGIGLDGAALVKPDRTIAWRASSLEANPQAALTEAFSRIVGMKPAAQQDGQGMVRSPRPAVRPAPPRNRL